jgi:hypothetical protein
MLIIFAAVTQNFSYELNKKKISLTGFPLVGFSKGIAQKFSCAKLFECCSLFIYFPLLSFRLLSQCISAHKV